MARLLILAVCVGNLLFCSRGAWAQLSNPLSTRVINYKTVFDDPYDINQLWLCLSPMSVQAGSDNVSLGYGLSTRLFIKDKFQLTAAMHTSYTPGTDLMQTNAKQNGSIRVSPAPGRKDQEFAQLNTYNPFTTFEVGGLFVIKDIEAKGTSRIMLASKKSRVMEFSTVDEIMVNSRKRTLWGARLGVQNVSSTVSLHSALEKQKLTLTSADGVALTPSGQTITANATSNKYGNQLFSSLNISTIYVGGSYQLIRNVAIKADKFGNLANNVLLTTFADIMVAPSPKLEDLKIATDNGGSRTFSTQDVVIRNMGFRAGMDLCYNQDLHYSFGAELGVRPGLMGQGFYFAGRVSFPTLAFKLSRRRLANEVNAQEQESK